MSVVKAHHQSKLALGSDTTIVLVSDLPSTFVDDLFVQIWLKIFTFERQFSRFLPSSELSMFNKNAGIAMPISTEFSRLLLTAKLMSQKTNGLYNPFILPALQKAGYYKSFVNKYGQDQVDDYSHRAVATIDKLHVAELEATIPANTALDLGGIGKGYLADQLANIPELSKIHGYWISLGGDVIGGGLNEAGQQWRVDIQNAQDSNKTLKTVFEPETNTFSIATSGTITRRDDSAKKPWHHIIDPITLRPAETDVLLATVVAKSAVEADVFASCAVILGSGKAPEFLKAQGIESYMLQTSRVDSQQVIIKQGNFVQKTEVKI